MWHVQKICLLIDAKQMHNKGIQTQEDVSNWVHEKTEAHTDFGQTKEGYKYN